MCNIVFFYQHIKRPTASFFRVEGRTHQYWRQRQKIPPKSARCLPFCVASHHTRQPWKLTLHSTFKTQDTKLKKSMNPYTAAILFKQRQPQWLKAGHSLLSCFSPLPLIYTVMSPGYKKKKGIPVSAFRNMDSCCHVTHFVIQATPPKKTVPFHAFYHYSGTVWYYIYIFLCNKHIPSYKKFYDLMLGSLVLWRAVFNCEESHIYIKTSKSLAWDMPSVPDL